MEARCLRRTVLVARFQMRTRRRSRNFVGDDCRWGTKGGVLGITTISAWGSKQRYSGVGLTEAAHQVRLRT